MGIASIELAFLGFLQSIRIVGLTQAMAFVSALSNAGLVWIFLALVMLCFAQKRQTGVVIIIAVAATAVVADLLLANHFARERPCVAGTAISAVIGVGKSGFSFPSSHVALGAAAATVLALMHGKKWGVPSFLFVVLIAFARMYCGVSYPSDCLAGALVGIVIGLAVAWVFNRYLYQILLERLGAGSPRRRSSVNKGKHSRY